MEDKVFIDGMYMGEWVSTDEEWLEVTTIGGVTYNVKLRDASRVWIPVQPYTKETSEH